MDIEVTIVLPSCEFYSKDFTNIVKKHKLTLEFSGQDNIYYVRNKFTLGHQTEKECV